MVYVPLHSGMKPASNKGYTVPKTQKHKLCWKRKVGQKNNSMVPTLIIVNTAVDFTRYFPHISVICENVKCKLSSHFTDEETNLERLSDLSEVTQDLILGYLALSPLFSPL